jgi:hypothetical protein
MLPITKQHPDFPTPTGSLLENQLWALARSDKNAVAYETILDCATMENTLNAYNRSWFRQASDTPFGHGDLFKMVGFEGLTEEADAILNGECIEYMGIPMSNELKVFLEECKLTQETARNLDNHSVTRTSTKPFRNGKNPPQHLPLGDIFGHYKAAILDEDITHLHVDMLNIPIQMGFAPERWDPLRYPNDQKRRRQTVSYSTTHHPLI